MHRATGRGDRRDVLHVSVQRPHGGLLDGCVRARLVQRARAGCNQRRAVVATGRTGIRDAADKFRDNLKADAGAEVCARLKPCS